MKYMPFIMLLPENMFDDINSNAIFILGLLLLPLSKAKTFINELIGPNAYPKYNFEEFPEYINYAYDSYKWYETRLPDEYESPDNPLNKIPPGIDNDLRKIFEFMPFMEYTPQKAKIRLEELKPYIEKYL